MCDETSILFSICFFFTLNLYQCTDCLFLLQIIAFHSSHVFVIKCIVSPLRQFEYVLTECFGHEIYGISMQCSFAINTQTKNQRKYNNIRSKSNKAAAVVVVVANILSCACQIAMSSITVSE